MVNPALMGKDNATKDTAENSNGINSEAKDADTSEAARIGFINRLDDLVDEYGDYVAFITGVLTLANFAFLIYYEVNE